MTQFLFVIFEGQVAIDGKGRVVSRLMILFQNFTIGFAIGFGHVLCWFHNSAESGLPANFCRFPKILLEHRMQLGGCRMGVIDEIAGNVALIYFGVSAMTAGRAVRDVIDRSRLVK